MGSYVMTFEVYNGGTIRGVEEVDTPRAGKHSFDLECIVKNVSSLSSIALKTLSLLYLKAPFHNLL